MLSPGIKLNQLVLAPAPPSGQKSNYILKYCRTKNLLKTGEKIPEKQLRSHRVTERIAATVDYQEGGSKK
jgi:hypothetical protein